MITPLSGDDAVFGKENSEWDALQKHLFPVLEDSGIAKNNTVKKVKGNSLGERSVLKGTKREKKPPGIKSAAMM